jgi:hypothetical protein
LYGVFILSISGVDGGATTATHHEPAGTVFGLAGNVFPFAVHDFFMTTEGTREELVMFSGGFLNADDLFHCLYFLPLVGGGLKESA